MPSDLNAATAPPDGLTSMQQRALARTTRECFIHAMVQSTPFLLVLVPFGLLFGVVSGEAGINLSQVVGFSLLVLAGASQFTAIQLISDHAPALVVIVSALAVNLRMAMYSASLVPWIGAASGRQRALVAYVLIDQSYALSIAQYERNPRLRMDQRLAYFFGAALAMCAPWVIASVLGYTLGKAIPPELALDFAVPITFLAMIGPMLRTLAHVAAALVSIIGALVFSFLPSGMGLLVAAPLAMGTGALVEVWSERRKAGQA